MSEAFICDAVRTPIGRYGGALAVVRADDLAALPLTALMERNPDVDWSKVDDLIYGCANQAGEDNRNVGRMAVLHVRHARHCSGNNRQSACADPAWMPSAWRQGQSAPETATS